MPERLLRLPRVLDITGLSRSRLYVLVGQGKFPEPIPIGEGSRARGWIGSEVNVWVQQQITKAAAIRQTKH